MLAEREREQLLAREQETHQHLEAILDNLSEGVLVIGSGRSVLFANASARNMLNMTEGSTPADLPDPCDDFSLRDAVDRCRRTGEIIEARTRCCQSFLQIRLDRLTGLEGNEVLMVLQDLSEGHQLEANQQRFLSNAAHQLRTPLTVIRLQNALWSLLTDAHAIGAAASVISLGSFFSPSTRRKIT